MACDHKFQQYLNLERIDFDPTTLVVGTFNPAWPDDNYAQWFYGRTEKNNFWKVLPRIYGEDSLIGRGPVEWKRFCHEKRIAITDIIASIDDADPGLQEHQNILRAFADEDLADKFYDFDLTNIVRILRNNPTIENIYITRGTTQAFWRNKIWPVKKYCADNGINIKSVLTPSGHANKQRGKYNRENPKDTLELPDYILMRWRKEWHEID